MSSGARPELRTLVVDDDETIVDAVRPLLEPRSARFASAGTLADASQLWHELRPTLVVLDVSLPDGDSVQWLSTRPDTHRAAIVAMSGCASAWQGHQLAKLGARVFLDKPFDAAALRAAVDRAIAPPDLEQAGLACVGHMSLQEAEETLRRSMIQEALARSAQSRRGAARLLDVSRQMLQHAIRKLTC